jgi:outer membrane protein assembly factor BamB
MDMVCDPKALLFIGTGGSVKAVDRRTGEDRWQASLPGTGYEIVSLLCEGDRVYAGSKGHVFALDARTGEILWTNGLAGLGHGHICLASQTSSTLSPSLLIAEQGNAGTQTMP